MTPYGTDSPRRLERRRDAGGCYSYSAYAKALRHRARQAASDVIAAELDMMATRERGAPVRGGQWLTTRDDDAGPGESRDAAARACCGSLNACTTG